MNESTGVRPHSSAIAGTAGRFSGLQGPPRLFLRGGLCALFHPTPNHRDLSPASMADLPSACVACRRRSPVPAHRRFAAFMSDSCRSSQRIRRWGYARCGRLASFGENRPHLLFRNWTGSAANRREETGRLHRTALHIRITAGAGGALRGGCSLHGAAAAVGPGDQSREECGREIGMHRAGADRVTVQSAGGARRLNSER
jgi:hypothetical protein